MLKIAILLSILFTLVAGANEKPMKSQTLSSY